VRNTGLGGASRRTLAGSHGVRRNLAEHDTEDEARLNVADGALAALADRWTLIDGSSGVEHVVFIQHARPAEVSPALGCYALPGVNTLTIPVEQLTSGRWRLGLRL